MKTQQYSSKNVIFLKNEYPKQAKGSLNKIYHDVTHTLKVIGLKQDIDHKNSYFY